MRANRALLVTLVLLLLAIVYIFFLRGENRKLADRVTTLNAEVEQAKKDYDSERDVWTKLYTDCINENNELIQRMSK
jgi:hypothetical protein